MSARGRGPVVPSPWWRASLVGIALAAACAPATVPAPPATVGTPWGDDASEDGAIDPGVAVRDTGDDMPPEALELLAEVNVDDANEGHHSHATVDVAADGTWLASWTVAPQPNAPGARYRPFDAAGVPTITARVIPSGESSHPQVTRVGERWMVTWTDHEEQAIRTAVWEDGHLVRPRTVTRISDGADDPEHDYPNYADVVALDTERALIVWRAEDHGGVGGLGARVIDVGTSVLGPLQRLDDSITGPPTLTPLGDGAALVWLHEEVGGRAVLTMDLDHDGVPVGSPTVVQAFRGPPRAGACVPSRTAAAARDDRLLVAWQCEHGGYRVDRSAHAVLLDARREPIATVLDVDLDHCGQRPVATTAGRWLLLSWEGCDPATPDQHDVWVGAWSYRTAEPVLAPTRVPAPELGQRQRPDLAVRRVDGGWEGWLTSEVTLADTTSRIDATHLFLRDGAPPRP